MDLLLNGPTRKRSRGQKCQGPPASTETHKKTHTKKRKWLQKRAKTTMKRLRKAIKRH